MTICSGDWMRLRVGDYLQSNENPRHISRVEAIHGSATVKLRWVGCSNIVEHITLLQAQTEHHKIKNYLKEIPSISKAFNRKLNAAAKAGEQEAIDAELARDKSRK
jgi:hypothetical protein